jgi:endonuclease/exonuclease/phosphatase family metal-dependent hydrolase
MPGMDDVPSISSVPSGTPVRPVRLVSWNIRDLTGDPLAVRAVLRELAPDVVCLQEAPRRPGSAWRIGGLARATGLRHVAGGRGSGGTALLVAPRISVAMARALPLPVPHWHTRTRGTVVARVRVPDAGGLDLAVACVHLPLHPQHRLAHAVAVRAELQARRPSPGAVVVAGDFNEPAGAPAGQAFAGLAGDPWPQAGPTFPARRPSGRIDAVLVGDALAVQEYGDGGVRRSMARLVERASDHLPVLAVLTAP